MLFWGLTIREYDDLLGAINVPHVSKTVATVALFKIIVVILLQQ